MALMKAATKKQKRRFAKLQDLGCIICCREAEIHHCGTHMGGGRDHDKVIPLCPQHHRTYDPKGMSIHGNRKEFENLFGSEELLMEKAERYLEEREERK